MSGIAFSTNVPHTVRGGPPLIQGRRRQGPADLQRGLPAGPHRHQAVHRLPSLEERRQQRDHGPAPDAGHELRRTSSAATAGWPRASTGWRRSSSPSATSRRRSSAARCTSLAFPDFYRKHLERGRHARASPTSTPAATSASDLARTVSQARDPRRPGPRRVPLRRLRRGRPARLRHRLHRPQGLLRADRHRAGLAARPAVLRPDQVRHAPSPRRRRSPPTRPAPTAPRTTSRRSTRCTATSTSPTRDEGLILVPAGTTARRQPAQQLPRPRADLQPRTASSDGARSDHDRRAPTPTSAATPAWSSSSLDDPEAPAGHRRRSASAFLKQPARGAGPVPLRLRLRRRRDQGPRRHRPGASRSRSSTLPLPDAHNIYLARTYAYVAAGPAGAGHPRHREPRAAAGSTRSSTPAAASTTCTT